MNIEIAPSIVPKTSGRQDCKMEWFSIESLFDKWSYLYLTHVTYNRAHG
jgi:hypothetical protein